MRLRYRLFSLAMLVYLGAVVLCLPAIAFSHEEQARQSALHALGLPENLDPSAADFPEWTQGIHPELLYIAFGVDARTADAPWRYDAFTWRRKLVLDLTGGLENLRERLCVAAYYVPAELILYVPEGQSAAVQAQIAQWLADGVLPDYKSYESVWNSGTLTYRVTWRQALSCAAWDADPATEVQDARIPRLTQGARAWIKSRVFDYTPERVVRRLHDQVAARTVYHNGPLQDGQEAADVFFKQEAVCAGYADAYRLLLLLSGIDCTYVIGTVEQDGARIPHGWNQVYLDGAWYHVDVTWDDPVGQEPWVLQDYFLKSDETMNQTHHWVWDACQSSPMDYF